MQNEWFILNIFQNNTAMLTVYQTKPTRTFYYYILHYTVSIGNEPKEVSDTVKYYNSFKYGVNVWTKRHNYTAQNVIHNATLASSSILYLT